MTNMTNTEIAAVEAAVRENEQDVSLLLGGDTETTGFEPKKDRVIEIALLDFDPLTGIVAPDNRFHMYFNPEREVPLETVEIHGLSNEFLAGQELFKDKRDEVAAKLEGRTFVAHNASFDVRMIEGEFAVTKPRGAPVITFAALGCKVICTQQLARQYVRTASRRYTLDALLEHFNVPAVGREKYHGAAVDVALMCAVYPRIEAARLEFRKRVDSLLTVSLDANMSADDLKDIAYRYHELETIRKFLEKEKDRLENFFIDVHGKREWADGRFEAKVSTSKSVDWEKVTAAHLKDVDLAPFTKTVERFSLKARY